MSTDKEQRTLNISFNKSGAGNTTPKLALPANWIKEMGITEDERQIIVTKIDDKIIIEKLKK